MDGVYCTVQAASSLLVGLKKICPAAIFSHSAGGIEEELEELKKNWNSCFIPASRCGWNSCSIHQQKLKMMGLKKNSNSSLIPPAGSAECEDAAGGLWFASGVGSSANAKIFWVNSSYGFILWIKFLQQILASCQFPHKTHL